MIQNNHIRVWVVSLHDRTQEGYLALDVTDIIECLYPAIANFLWVGFDLEFTGEPVQEGTVLTTSELLTKLQQIRQTIDGKFLGYSIPPLNLGDVRNDYSCFPESDARVAIVAVDSSYFEVYTKEPTVVDMLKQRFFDVREENPNEYFTVTNGQ